MNVFKSLKSKLVVSCTIILVITVIVNLIIGIVTSRMSIESNVRQDLHSIGTMADVAISNSLDKIKLGATSMASLDYIGDSSVTPEAQLSKLDADKGNYGFSNVFLVEGGKILSSDKNLNGKDIGGQAYFKPAMLGVTYLSSVVTDMNNKKVIFVSSPVKNGKFNGYLVGYLDVQTYSNIIKNIKVGQTGNVFIVDKTGNMIANMRPALVESSENFIEKAKTDSSYASSAEVYKKMVA